MHITPLSLKSSNEPSMLYNCMQCAFFWWWYYLNWMESTCAIHVTYLSESKRIISFKIPKTLIQPILLPSFVPLLNLRCPSYLHRRWCHCGSFHWLPIALPPYHCGLHTPQILHRHSSSQTLASTLSPKHCKTSTSPSKSSTTLVNSTPISPTIMKTTAPQ